MMNAIDLLKYRLGGPSRSLAPEGDMAWLDRALQGGAALQPPALPEGLPQVVQDSIRNQPSWGEGGVIPGAPNPLMEQEHAAGAFFGPQREDPLRQGLGDVLRLRQEELPMSEGEWLTTRPELQSPYATRLPSALNQLMQRGPFGQY